ncbi:MAG: thermonuclease family protein [Pseudomonadota bacterium]
MSRRRRRLPLFRIALAGFLIYALWSAATRQDLSGAATIHDGDTLTVAGERVRLYGLDAPELDQTCLDRNRATYACGRLARRALERIATGGLRCETVERDRYDRAVAICFAGERDVGAALVSSGWARAYLRYSLRYAAAEAAAKDAGRGLWAGEFDDPWAYREDGFKDDLIALAVRWVRERLF